MECSRKSGCRPCCRGNRSLRTRQGKDPARVAGPRKMQRTISASGHAVREDKAQRKLEIEVNWCEVPEPSPLWRKLWERLLVGRARPPSQPPVENALAGGSGEVNSHEKH